MKHLWIKVAFLVAGFAGQGGCSDEEVTGAGAGATGGGGGTAGTAGSGGTADSSAGTAGSGGAAGSSGGSGGSGGTAGAEAGPPPLNPRRIVAAQRRGADGGGVVRRLLVAGTDYQTKTEVATLDLGTSRVTGSVSFDDGDAVPDASNGHAFVLERSNDRVHLLSSEGEIDKTIDVTAAPTGAAVDPENKAYVLLYNTSRIAVVDLDAGVLARGVNLGAFAEPQDSDGAVDMDDAVIVPGTERMYLVLGRFDRTTIAAPSFQLACQSWPALLVGVDTATDSTVDLNGTAEGHAIELSLVSPTGMHFDEVNNRLLILNSGCFTAGEGGSRRVRHGIEAVDLATGTASVVLEPADESFLNRLIVLGAGEAALNSFDDLGDELWHRWSVGSPALGPELSGVPAAPSFDGRAALIGVAFTTNDGSTTASVVSYTLDGTTTALADSPWTGSFSASSGSALVE